MEQTKVRLIEGESYSFILQNKIKMPSDLKKFWVMQGMLGAKYLLPAEYYINYNFEEGLKIDCKLDKINCTGKLFFEPSHPYYRENNEYEWEIVGKDKETILTGETLDVLFLKDKFGNKIRAYKKLVLDDGLSDIGVIKATVHKIKKGQIYLFNPGAVERNFELKTGQIAEFNITERKKLKDQRDYLILLDKYNKSHILPLRHFTKYELKTGSQIECMVVGMNSRGYFFLEPLHPHYQIGRTYTFKVARTEDAIQANNMKKLAITYSDCLGTESTIIIEKSSSNKIHKNTIQGEVLSFYKSQVIVGLV